MKRENGRVQGHQKRGRTEHLIGTQSGEKGGDLAVHGAILGVVLVASGNGGNN